MDCFDEGWDHAAPDAGLEPDSDPEEFWRSLIADEEHPRYWSESVWSHDAEDAFQAGSLLFPERTSEAELRNEIRLSELWGLCERDSLSMSEFFEVSALISKVAGLRDTLCADCTVLGRPNVRANWALAATTLCRTHLRFRLDDARIDGGTGRH